MKKQQLKVVALSTFLSAGLLLGNAANAAEVKDILAVGSAKTASAKKSQVRIDSLQETTVDLAQQFKRVNKQIEDLKVYNQQMENQIARQLEVLKVLDESISQATEMERQIPPLTLRMIEGLKQFISMDLPFLEEEREERIVKVESAQETPSLTVAEKFRQVLEAYNIEAEYGRKISQYKGTIEINGADREVNILQVGRVALLYQTTDTELTGAYNKTTKTWEPIDSGTYRTVTLQALKVARKQATPDVLSLPIIAPEAM